MPERPNIGVWRKPEDHKVQNRVERALAGMDKEQKRLTPETSGSGNQEAKLKKEKKDTKLTDGQFNRRNKAINTKFHKKLRDAGVVGGRKYVNMKTGKEINPWNNEEKE